MGQKLAASLNHLIDERIANGESEEEIISMLATAADIDPEKVNQILQGELSPPQEHLRAFASVLEDKPQVTIKEVIPKEKYERLLQIKAELERTLDP